jgi:hypothetical protein
MNNGKYIDLDINHKKELLVNLKALYLVASGLSSVTGRDLDPVVDEIWREAYFKVAFTPDDEVCRLVADIEQNHKLFVEAGEIVDLY